MSQRKLTGDEIVRLQRILDEGDCTVFGTQSRVGQSRRVRLFVAPARGSIEEVTGWLRHAGYRFDKEERAIVTGGGFCAIQHVVNDIHRLAGGPRSNLKHKKL